MWDPFGRSAIFVSGTFSDTVDFTTGGPDGATLTANGEDDIFVMRVDRTGP